MTIRRLGLDFAPRRRAGTWLGGSILLVGVLAAILAGRHYAALSATRDALESAVREQARNKPMARASDNAAARERVQRKQAARRSVARSLGLPWGALLHDIESTVSDDVGLLALEPDPRRGEVRIAAEARDAQAMYAYLAALEATPSLARANLAQHEIVAEAGQSAIRFVVVAAWRGLRE